PKIANRFMISSGSRSQNCSAAGIGTIAALLVNGLPAFRLVWVLLLGTLLIQPMNSTVHASNRSVQSVGRALSAFNDLPATASVNVSGIRAALTGQRDSK